MQTHVESSLSHSSLQIECFDRLQERYQSLGLAARAELALRDAEPALQAADAILQKLAKNKNLDAALADIRKNFILAGKMRPSEARNLLLDASADFIEATRHKLAAWSKTMLRLSQSEGIAIENGRECISRNAPIALAIAGNACVSSYLSMLQMVIAALTKVDSKHAKSYGQMTVEIRRCSTVLGDCESASGIAASVN
jgi:hypothetical protein